MDGKISFFGSSNVSEVRIEVEDKETGNMILVGTMTAEDFGRAITGLSLRPISYELGNR